MKTLLFSDVKKFMKKKLNQFYFLQVFSVFLILCCLISSNIAIKKTERKVDFRYFNTVRTIEDIYGIDINTKDGSFTPRTVNNQWKH